MSTIALIDDHYMAVATSGYGHTGLITRPANQTPYGIGDAIGSAAGAAFTMPNMGPMGGSVLLQSVVLLIHSATLPTNVGPLRLHLYSSAPSAIADNDPWDLSGADVDRYLDSIDLPTPVDMGSTAVTKGAWCGSMLRLAPGSTSLWGMLQHVGADGLTFAEGGTVLDLRVGAVEAGR